MASDTGTPTAPASPVGAEPPAARSGAREVRRRRTAAWLIPLLLLLVAASVRFYNLGHPPDIYFDETYYVDDSRSLLEQGVEDGFSVHPPVGKWLLAGGIALAGDHPFGWRLASAVTGSLTVLVLYLAALRLFRRRGPAALAALLLATDGLALTMSRIAMLDAALTLFVTLAFWLLLVDRDRMWQGVPAVPPGPGEDRALPRRGHRWRWLAGLALGLALATKWSAVLAIGAAGLFVLGSELAFRRRTTGHALRGWHRAAASAVLTLLVVPAVVYVASYSGWFASYELTRPGQDRCPEESVCAVPAPTIVADWFGEQREIAGFHSGLDAEHPYRASALTWPLQLRPVAYHYESCTPARQERLAEEGGTCVVEEGNVVHILGLGNPLLWWLAFASYPWLLWAGAVRRDWRALAIAAFLLGQYVPWLAATRPLFAFYLLPIVPFVALALTYAVEEARRHPLARWVPGVVALLVLAAFAFWFPLWVGLEIPDGAWRVRMWLPGWI